MRQTRWNRFESWRRMLQSLVLAAGLALLPLCSAADYVVEVTAGTNIAALAAKYGFTVVKQYGGLNEVSYRVTAAEPLTTQAFKSLGKEKSVERVDFDSTIRSPESSAPRTAGKLEPLGNLFASRVGANFYGSRVLAAYVNQPGMAIIQLAQAHQSFGGGSGIIAIIDTGVDTAHPALARALVPGYDFTRDRPDTVSELNDLTPYAAKALTQSTVEILDGNKVVVSLSQSTVEILDQSTVEILDAQGVPSAFGHGTMTAGLVHLVAPNARIMPLKAFRADGSASLYDIDRAIRYATDHGANVINMSFSYAADSPVLKAAVQYASSKGVLAVAASGNLGLETAAYPASYPSVTGVGSTNYSDHRSPFSNHGSSARTSAVGEALVTLYPGGNYAAVWGTSFSTALVSGAAGLMMPIKPALRYDLFRDSLDSGVKLDADMGDARLDLLRSLTALLGFR